MAYKAFQDFYLEESIKHLLLTEYNGCLVSPPFATEKCKDYNQIMIIGNDVSFIDLDLPPATSKFNAYTVIGDSLWLIPYGIWDNFNVVVQLKDFKPIYHYIDKPGKGQFYNVASNGETAFSFPLGYEDTSFGIFIRDQQVHTVEFEKQSQTKLHMGCVYANGKYWSAPRGDEPGYVNMMSFDGEQLKSYPINLPNPNITRKYTDIIVKGNTLYAMPFGEQPGLMEVIEFDTVSENYKLHKLNMPDVAKKFNCMVEVDEYIIGLPYGTKGDTNSRWGISFNTTTNDSACFDLGEDFADGGKYRFRCGVNFNNNAVFFPAGTPDCPIVKVSKDLTITTKHIEGVMFGRPIVHDNKLKVLGYDMRDATNSLYEFDESLTYSKTFLR